MGLLIHLESFVMKGINTLGGVIVLTREQIIKDGELTTYLYQIV